MRRQRAYVYAPPVLAGLAILAVGGRSLAENIDPASRYAWAENVGWMNAQPMGPGGPGIQVGDSELSGWIWGENIGWVSLSCKNDLSCGTSSYRILNDGHGMLSGNAWAENAGWINFSPLTSGVSIDPSTGDFSGYAWGENIGWISFNCANSANCGTSGYKVNTGWRCVPLPTAPSGSPQLSVDKLGSGALLSWNRVAGATGSDVVRGTLSILRSNGGNFTAATNECLDNNRTTTSLLYSGIPAAGDGFWFLVRGQNCGGNGSYDDGSQQGSRDAGIAASGNACP